MVENMKIAERLKNIIDSLGGNVTDLELISHSFRVAYTFKLNEIPMCISTDEHKLSGKIQVTESFLIQPYLNLHKYRHYEDREKSYQITISLSKPDERIAAEIRKRFLNSGFIDDFNRALKCYQEYKELELKENETKAKLHQILGLKYREDSRYNHKLSKGRLSIEVKHHNKINVTLEDLTPEQAEAIIKKYC
jgi:hypothetical protein